jgi:hypothetical protein
MIPWREKWRAFAIHFAVTLVLAVGAAVIIFALWFPDPFDTLVGGAELFALVVGCDLALGPLISLVIYDSRKSRRKLVFDYAVVAFLQISALIYGVWVIAGSRPVYVAFSTDRLEVVAAADIRPAELAAARDPNYRSLPLTGPRLVAIVVPPADHNDALFQSLDGNEEPARPKFYQPYESQLPAILAHALPLETLETRHPEGKAMLAQARAKAGVPAARLRWLPLRYREVFWTVLIDAETGQPLAYFNLDPY